MSTRIVAIVEGHGEVQAVPVLLRRIAESLDPDALLEVPRPILVKRQRFVKHGELERTVELAARQAGERGRILVLLDADDECPKELAAEVLRRARAVRADREIRVVVAKREYEAWFLAAAASIAGHRGLAPDLAVPPDPEGVRGAKAWLSQRMESGRSYRETLDQPALTATFDLEAARRAPSFAKLWRDVVSLL